MYDTKGPAFVIEPPSKVEFLNTAGGRLDCLAAGNPQPTVTWLLSDGSPLSLIPSIRLLLQNGSLHFPPFDGDSFRQDIHWATYRCLLTNRVGTIISRDVTLRADGKYHMFASGELLILNVSSEDIEKRFKCRIHHKLTQEVVVSSNFGKIILADEQGTTKAPSMVNKVKVAHVRSDGVLAVPCVATGNPPPTYKWYRKTGHSQEVALNDTERVSTQDGTLVIIGAGEDDSGVYYCQAWNVAGSDTLTLTVTVSLPLTVHVQPAIQIVHLGAKAELNCNVHGFPRNSITWYKDGQAIRLGGKMSETTLLITHITKEDEGMYQCMVKNELEMCQGAAHLQMGEAYPTLAYRFIEQTMQPGPSVSLKCSASGNPTPQISWLLDGYHLPPNERLIIGQYVTVFGDVISHVNITSVKPEDSGEYECVAENKAGRSRHTARLNIYGLPFVRSMAPIAAVAEQTLVIKCPVAGYPIDTVVWEKGGIRLPASLRQRVDTNSLTIENVQADSDEGSYVCVARNKQGHTSHGTIKVSVVIPPKITPFSFPRDLKLGDRISVQCLVVSGDEPLWFVWLKDGAPPPEQDGVNIRTIDPYTSTFSIPTLTSANSGNYTCKASNSVSTVTHTATLNVNAPPRIAPFYFGENLTTGMRAEVMCSSSRGDLPLNISWSKDGVAISHVSGIHINNERQFSSILTIVEVTPSHTGNYTCQISNPAGLVTRTASLYVTVPPYWLTQPIREQSVIVGNSALLDCNADGFPKPTTTWKITTGVHLRGVSGQPSADEYREVTYSSHSLLKMENGSLQLMRASAGDEGFYMCSANNGVGAGKSALIRLSVHASPVFAVRNKEETARKGNTVYLRCEAEGDQPIEVAWRFRGVQLDVDHHVRCMIRNTSLPSGVLSELTIMEVSDRDKGTYLCTATNAYGADHANIKLLVEEPPSFPRDLRVIKQTSRSISLHWSPPSTFGDSKVNYYILHYKEAKDEWHEHSPQLTISGDSTGVDVEGLKPATMYHFRIYAENQLGVSDASDVLHGVTEGEAPTGVPRQVSAEAVLSTQIHISWHPPDISTWNGDLTGYKIGYKLLGVSGGYNYTHVRVSGDFRLEGLESFKNYSIVVSATNNRGEGPRSEPIIVQTKEGVPSSPPQDVQCNTLTSQSLQVSWRPPPAATAHGHIIGYHVLSAPSEDWYFASSREMKKVAQSLSTVLHGLRPFTNYSLQALALTQAGEGARSHLIHCVTHEAVPGAPAAIKAIASGKTSVTVGWLPPKEPNGNIAFYTVHIRRLQQSSQIKTVKIPAHILNFKVEMREEETCEAWVSAATKVGSGHSTNVVRLVTSAELPAKIVSFGQDKTVTWKSNLRLECIAVGQPQVHLEWRHAGIKLQKGPRLSISNDKTLTIANIERGDEGNYSCHVHNSLGSDSIVYTVSVQVPPSAPILLVTAITTESVRLQWKQGNMGGSRIRGYTLACMKQGEGSRYVNLEESISTYLVEGLNCGTEYHFSLTAYNKIGPGLASNWNIQRTKGSRPISPSKSHFLSVNSTCATLHLSTWGDGGCVLSHFSLDYKQNHGEWIKISELLKPLRVYYLSGLRPDTEYVVKVGAHNHAGTTVQQYPFKTTQIQGGIKAPNSATYDEEYVETDVRIISLGLAFTLSVLVTVATVGFCLRRRSTTDNGHSTATLDNKHNMAQHEQYYTTVRKVPHSRYIDSTQLERIPEHSEDIYPYATFHLAQFQNLSGNKTERQVCVHESQITEFTKEKMSDKKSDSEDYDSIGSDSDIEHSPLGNRSIRHSIVGPVLEGDCSTSTEVSPTSERREKFKKRTKRGSKDLTANHGVCRRHSNKYLTSDCASKDPTLHLTIAV